jgi:hypothetical protein
MEDSGIYRRLLPPTSVPVLISRKEGLKEIDAKVSDFLTQVSQWTGISIDSNSFRDSESKEIIDWRKVQEGHRYTVGGVPIHKIIKVHVKFCDKNSAERTIDLEGDMGAQWNGMARKEGVGAPFKIARNSEEVRVTEVEERDELEVRPAWDASITIQNETGEKDIRYQRDAWPHLRAKVQSWAPNAVLHHENRRIRWEDAEDEGCYPVMPPPTKEESVTHCKFV